MTRTPLEILSSASAQFLNVHDEREVYSIMRDSVLALAPDVYFLVSKLQPDDMNFRIVESAGFDRYFTRIVSLLGGLDPYEIDFPFKDLTAEQLQAFASRKVHHFSGGIHDVVNEVVPKVLCRAIEKLLRIGEVCGLSLSVDKSYYGGMILFIPAGTFESGGLGAETELAIEALANQASTVIQRLRDMAALRESENTIRRTQRTFRQLLSQMTDIVWSANGDGSSLTDMNGTFLQYYGYSVQDFQTNPLLWLEVVHPEDRHIAENAAKELLTLDKTDVEYRIVRADGRILWLHDRKTILRDEDGTPNHMAGIASDITQRKLLEQQLRVKDAALDASPTAVGLADMTGTLFYANSAYLSLWGYRDKEDIIGKNVTELASSTEIVEDVLQTLKRGEVYHGDGQGVRMDGTPFDCTISASIVKDGTTPICMMALFIDITERLMHQRMLQQRTEHLIEIGEARDRLYTLIAHDLRAPFSSIMGTADLLASSQPPASIEEKSALMGILVQSVHSTYELLERLLDWSQLRDNQLGLEKEEQDLRTLVEESILPHIPQAVEKGLTVDNHITEDVTILLDSRAMQAIVRNLFYNAIKFTPSGGRIGFESEEAAAFVELRVCDTGVGMTEHQVRTLFEPSVRNSSTGTEAEPGTGLGLHLCKDLADKSGVSMIVESEVGEGTTFHIRIPVDKSHAD